MEKPNMHDPYEPIPENYLADINQRLDALEKKRKRRRVLFLCSPFLLLAGIYLGSYQTLSTEVIPRNMAAQTPQETQKNTKVDSKHSGIVNLPSKKALEQNPNPQEHTKHTSNAMGKTHEGKRGNTSQPHVGKSSHSSRKQNSPKVQFESIDSSNLNVQPEKQKSESLILPKEIPMLSEHRISFIPWPVLGTLQKRKTHVSWQHMIGFSSGVGGIISSFTPIDIAGNAFNTGAFGNYKNYALTRKAAERATSSWDLSFFYRTQKNRWFYQIGIAYNEWGEQIVYPFNSIDGTNRYRYLNIPIFAGYQWTKNKVSLSPMLGLSAGIKLSGRGYYLMPDGGVDIVEAQTFSTSGIAQIELAYHLNPFIFHFTPGIRSAIGSPVKSAVTKNHYQAIGCQIGFIYKFEGKP